MLLLALFACDPDVSAEAPTWHADVAPILQARCASCHSEGGPAPFALTDHSAAAPLAGVIWEAVDSGRMPPWHAQDTEECQPLRPWKDDLRVSASERETLRAWAEAGSPEGDPAGAAPLPEAPSLTLENPKAELLFPVTWEVEGDSDQFVCFVLDPGHDQTVWVSGVQMVADNADVAHHALIFLDSQGETASWSESDAFDCFNLPGVDGSLLAGWAPGGVPTRLPEGVGVRMDPGARVVVQMHYHPTGEGMQLDRSSVQLDWSTEEPEYEYLVALLGNFNSYRAATQEGLLPGPNDPDPDQPRFLIPAGVKDHTETMVYRQSYAVEFPIWTVATHMHYVGTDMKIDLVRKEPDTDEPAEECLLQTPDWDFNWQRGYAYDVPIDELPRIGAGDRLVMRCTYDNTLDNPFVAEALAERGQSEPQDVYLGEETLDEMCLGALGVLLPPGLL